MCVCVFFFFPLAGDYLRLQSATLRLKERQCKLSEPIVIAAKAHLLMLKTASFSTERWQVISDWNFWCRTHSSIVIIAIIIQFYEYIAQMKTSNNNKKAQPNQTKNEHNKKIIMENVRRRVARREEKSFVRWWVFLLLLLNAIDSLKRRTRKEKKNHHPNSNGKWRSRKKSATQI